MAGSISRVRFLSDGLSLEGELRRPPKETRDIAVVCHPHPQRGGDMRNNVVLTVARAFLDAGCAVLTFNFRGVGASEGAFDGGAGEARDVLAAVDYARGLEGVERVLLAGYSFGAGRAAAVADASISALALVSLPAGALESGEALAAYGGPVLFASGSDDPISPAPAIQSAAARLPLAQTVVVEGADHFWWGHEDELTEALQAFARPLLEGPTGLQSPETK